MNQVVLALGFGLVTSSIVALGAVGFTLQFSVSHIFNVAYGAVMTAAAYVAYFVNVTLGVNIWIGLAAGAVGGALISVVIQRYIYAPFSRRGSSVFALIMVSLALSIIIQNALQAVAGPEPLSYNVPRQHAIHVGDIIWTANEVVIMAIAVASMLVLHGVLHFSRLGKAMRAVADDADLTRNCGIDSRKVSTIAWALSGALCGIAGVALALDTVSFANDIGINFLIIVIAAAVIGGVGEPYGAVVGALIVGLATELAALVTPDLKDVVAFALLALMLLVRPNGLRAGGALRTEAAA